MKTFKLLFAVAFLGLFNSAHAEDAGLDVWKEISATLAHPRCSNCHSDNDRPHWFDPSTKTFRIHGMNVQRGADGANFGNPGLRCNSCHQEHNSPANGGPPGAPNWHLAPIEMAWFNKSSAEVCAQFKDLSRNGNRDIAALADHVLNDKLVAWGWAPGSNREPAPGSAQQLHDAILKWQAAGAPCPVN